MAGRLIRIAGIAGSLRGQSFNRKLLAAAIRLCPKDAEIEVIDWSAVPVYNQDIEETNFPQVVTDIKNRVKASDAVLFVTPEYNYSIPGPLKNLIDWASRPYGDSCWAGKPVAVMGTSPGKYSGASGTGRAQHHLRQSWVFLNMKPVQQPEVMVTDAPSRFDANGDITDSFIRQNMINQLTELIKLTRTLAGK